MRPNTMSAGSMAGGENGSVRRFAGAQLAQLEALHSQMSAGLEAEWRAKAGKQQIEVDEEIARMFPGGIGGASSAGQGPDYRQVGGAIGEGLKGLFGGSGGSRSGGSRDFGAAFSSGFDADRATNLGWSMKGSLFSR